MSLYYGGFMRQDLAKAIMIIKEFIFYGWKFVAHCDRKQLEDAIDILMYYRQFETNDKKGE